MKIKKFNKAKIMSILIGFLVSIITPFTAFIPQASATAIIWNGGGVGVENTTNKTWIFDLADTANWVGGIAPVDGDSIVLPANTAVVDPDNSETDDYNWKYIINIPTAISLAGITFSGDTGSDCTVFDDAYKIAGADLTLTGDISVSATGSCSYYTINGSSLTNSNIIVSAPVVFGIKINGADVSPATNPTVTYGANNISFCDTNDSGRLTRYMTLSGLTLTGTGDVTFACGTVGYSGSGISGNIVVESGVNTYSSSSSLDSTTGKSITFKSGATFNIDNPNATADVDFSRNIVFVGSGTTQSYCVVTDDPCPTESNKTYDNYRGMFGAYKYNATSKDFDYYKFNVKGSVTLSSNTVFSTNSDTVFSGALSGNYTIKPAIGSWGKLVINSANNATATVNSTTSPEVLSQKLTTNPYGDYIVYNGRTAELVTGVEVTHKITAYSGSKLKGDGKVAGLDIYTGAVIAPGQSPGCINSNGNVTINGTYEAEVGGTTACTGFDQLQVTGAVDITGATLSASLYNSYAPKLNETYAIISNDGSDIVTGTFVGLAEGATFKVGEYTLGISYKGGDGNDVVLSVTAVPATVTVADTGVGSLMSSPFGVMIMALLAGGVLVVSRKFNKIKR